MDDINVQIIEEQIDVSIIEDSPIICEIVGSIGGSNITSIPPQGSLPVKNIYVDPNTGKLIIQYDDGGI